MNDVEFKDLEGKKILAVTHIDDEIRFVTDSGTYKQYHYQDCCESVTVEEIIGDLADLIDETVVEARVEVNTDEPSTDNDSGSHTWTFYIIRTNKSTVTIRWYGTSNGYYSESVDFVKVSI